jgi:hypothetical protein
MKKNIVEAFFNYLTVTPVSLLFMHLLWIVIASCALSTSYILAFHFTSVLNIYREAHDIKNFNQNLKLSAAKDLEIQGALQNIMESTKANRAYVFRFHNGLARVSDIPFFFQSLTHEVISPGTARVMQFEQHIPTSINMTVNDSLVKNQCAIIKNADDDKDSTKYWYFQIRAAKDLIRCPIFMANGDLFGIVGLDYLGGATYEHLKESESKLKSFSIILSTIFANKK